MVVQLICRIVVGHEQKLQFDIECELLRYLNMKFKRLDLDIVLMESRISSRRYRETFMLFYNAEPIDLAKYSKNKSSKYNENISHQSFVVRYLLRDYLRAGRDQISKQKLYVKCKDPKKNNKVNSTTISQK